MSARASHSTAPPWPISQIDGGAGVAPGRGDRQAYPIGSCAPRRRTPVPVLAPGSARPRRAGFGSMSATNTPMRELRRRPPLSLRPRSEGRASAGVSPGLHRLPSRRRICRVRQALCRRLRQAGRDHRTRLLGTCAAQVFRYPPGQSFAGCGRGLAPHRGALPGRARSLRPTNDDDCVRSAPFYGSGICETGSTGRSQSCRVRANSPRRSATDCRAGSR